jgi:hypothetical protein
MAAKRRRWDHISDEDPAAGLLNLFDVWIAFAVALLLATVSYYSAAGVKSATQSKADAAPTSGQKIDHYRATDEKLTGQGERLGTAYRLANGEVVYVPDAAPSSATNK